MKKTIFPILLMKLAILLFLGFWLFYEFSNQKSSIQKIGEYEKLRRIKAICELENYKSNEYEYRKKWLKDTIARISLNQKIPQKGIDSFFTVETKLVDSIFETTYKTEYYILSKSQRLNSSQMKAINTINAEVISNKLVLSKITPQIIFASILLVISSVLLFNIYRSSRRKERDLLERNYFFRSLTHELKTPLAIISASMQAIKTFQTDEVKREEYIGSALNQVDTLNLSIDRILSQHEMSTIDLQLEEIELNELIKKTIKVCINNYKSREVHISFNPSRKDIYCNLDFYHFQNMLINFIDNGIKYTNKTPEVSITLSPENDLIKIIIKDNGIGIDKDYLSKIFQRFFRINDKRAKYVEGHGIGLFYANEIVTMHNGKIEILSNHQMGTEIVLTFIQN